MSFFAPTAATGNGLSLGTFGRSGEIMGFFYPRIDFAQNIREGLPALRFLEPGDSDGFVWMFQDCWRVAQSFEPAGNVLVTRLAHVALDLNLEITDVFPPSERGLLRRIIITKDCHVGPVQFQHYLRMAVGDMAIRNAVQAYPDRNVVVQHHRDVAVAVSATRPFAAQCSTWQAGGESPTKQAMRAGHFGSSPQAIGRVDFALGFEPMHETRWQATLVLAGGATRDEAIAAAVRLTRLDFDTAVRDANDRVARELADAPACPVPELADAYERAVISLHDLYDETESTFIAAPEFDPGFELSGGYGYCWPRDAVVCGLAMDHLGRSDLAERFFAWSAKTQLPSGHWYQRYWTNGSAAPSWCVQEDQIQLDQTCAMVHAAGRFARRLADRDPSPGHGSGGEQAAKFIQFYRPVAQRAVHALLDYLGDDGLHRPATDLWENSVGTFAYTQAGMIAAFREAEEVFDIEPERTGPAVRAHLRERLITTFWDPARGCWLRRITPEGEPDATLDSSAVGLIYPWDVLDLRDPDDRRLALDTLDGISRNLRSEVKGGGAILRFEGESYMGGGPGCVNTLWLALTRLRVAAALEDSNGQRQQRRFALEDVRVALANANPTGQLPELIPKMEFDYWAAPHAWASALLIEIVLTLRAFDGGPTTPFDAARARVQRRAPSR